MWNPQSRENINHHRHISYWALHSHESLSPCWENQWSKNATCLYWCALWLHPQSLSMASSTQSLGSKHLDTHRDYCTLVSLTQYPIWLDPPRKKSILQWVRNNNIKSNIFNQNNNDKMSSDSIVIFHEYGMKNKPIASLLVNFCYLDISCISCSFYNWITFIWDVGLFQSFNNRKWLRNTPLTIVY